MEMQKLSDEKIKLLTDIVESVNKGMTLLFNVGNQESVEGCKRLKEGLMWAQQAVLNEESKIIQK